MNANAKTEHWHDKTKPEGSRKTTIENGGAGKGDGVREEKIYATV